MKKSRRLMMVAFLLAASFLLTSCLGLGSSEVVEEEPTYTAASPAPAMASDGVYYDFEDIQIPGSLKLNRDDSFVYQSETIKTGILSFTGGKTTVDSLAFFEMNMPRDGWTMMSSFRYNKNILIYTKPGKICLVMINEPKGINFVTVQVWVAPLKPGAENVMKSETPGLSTSANPPLGQTQTGTLPLVAPEGQGPKEETIPGS